MPDSLYKANKDKLTDLPGYNTAGFEDAWNKYTDLQNQSIPKGAEWSTNHFDVAKKELANYADVFRQHFNDFAGRDPNEKEYNRFYQEVVAPQGSYPGGGGMSDLVARSENLIRNSLAGGLEKEKKIRRRRKPGITAIKLIKFSAPR